MPAPVVTSPSAPPAHPVPAALVDREDVRRDVDGAVRAHLAALTEEVRRLAPGATAMTEQVRELLEGGKRLRAAFCYWSYRAHGGAPDGPGRTAAIRVGAALELFQGAALLHDDVIDGSDTRRGRPTAHRAFAARHATGSWAGDGDRFGESVAILLGDLVLVSAQRELTAALSALAPAAASLTRETFDLMQSEVVVGQYLDVVVQAEPWGADPVADEVRAREVLRAKTASYSAAAPLALGAALAGAGRERVAAVHAAGVPLGEAFQLRDDVLGVFGDPEVTGKPAGDDLREGKRTVLVARTLAAADEAQRALVLRALGDPGLGPDDVRALREAIVATGALAEVEALLAELAERSAALLAAADLTEPGRGVLTELARAAVHRTA